LPSTESPSPLHRALSAPLRRVRALVRRRIPYRVTLGGALFAVGLAFTGFAALLSANNLLFLVFTAMLALLLVSGFLSRLMLAGLEVELLLPRHVTARAPTAAKIRLRNLKKITPSFSVELGGRKDPVTGLPSILSAPVYFPVIPGGAEFEAAVNVNFPRRGRHVDNVFVISTRFPFGFLRRSTAVELRRETLVYPALEPSEAAESLLAQAEGELEAVTRGSGHDFHRIRPWESSDSARHVDWKTTAHTDRLQVREYTRDEQPAVALTFDRRIPPQDRELFESAIERCAWLIWNLDSRGLEVTFVSQQAFLQIPGQCDVYEILAWLALTEPLPLHLPPPDFAPDTPFGQCVRIDLSLSR
jgi:uncharacterized protein (DUF58 family)